MTLVCNTWEAGLVNSSKDVASTADCGRVFQPLNARGRKRMCEHIFATVEQDEFDVIALSLDCDRCSIVYHGKHGQVVMGFVDNTQMHIKPTSLEGSQLRDCVI